MTAVDRVIAVGALVVLTGVALALPPRPFGDAPEYLLMAESWAAHGSPELRPGDVEALRRHAAASGIAASPDDALGNYFEGRDGRFYCYHFAFYPLFTLPARWALGAVAGDVLKAGPLNNAIALGGAIAAVLLLVPVDPWARRAAAALLLSSPALGFLLWPHPEVLSPPLALLAVFEALRPGLADAPVPWSRARVWLTLVAGLLVLASPLFFLAEFSTPNLAAYETAGAHAMGIGKAASLMLDPELGLVRYAPLTVGLLVALVVMAARRPSRKVEGALVIVLALMMLLSSATGNWNHGTTGPSRYVVWMFPVIAYLLALGPTATDLLAGPRRTWAALLAVAVMAQVAVAAARGGVQSPLDYLEHSTMARAILDRWPAAYLSDFEVFRERTVHSEADLDGPFIHERDGQCRKALARWKHADTLRARCGPIPDAVRPFFESRPPKEEKGRWIYVDY